MNPPLKVLIVKLSAIGDVTLSTPVAEALRRQYPGAEIHWLVGEKAAPLLQNNPHVDRLILINENIFWRKKFLALSELFFQLKFERYQKVYILHWSSWFHLFFRLMGIPERIGFARDGRSMGLTQSFPYVEASETAHDVTQYLRLASPTVSFIKPSLFFTEDEISTLENSVKQWMPAGVCRSPGEGGWIAIAPGGGNNPKLFMPQKRWPAERFVALIRLLFKDDPGLRIFLLGDDSESDLLGSEFAKDSRVVQLAGRLSLRQTALLLQQCRLFIGNDSGLLHLAGALDIPSISFFGPTSPAGKTPFWTKHAVLYTKEPCSPCYKYGEAPPCPYSLKCLYNISAESALEAARRLRSVSSHA
jgi:heptosyltransferase II